MNNKDYWRDRTIKDAIENWKLTTQTEKELDQLFSSVLKDIQKEVSAFYANYATDNLFTYQAINELLTSHEQLINAKSIAELVDALTMKSNNPFVLAELAKIQATPTITRLQELMKRIAIQSVKLAYEQEALIHDNLTNIYSESYYHNLYNLAIGTGKTAMFTKLPIKAIEAAIAIPISGTYFSEAIWDNREVLAKKLRVTLTEGLAKGYSNQKMAKLLAEEMNSAYKMSLRVIRTETSKAMSEGSLTAYQDFGVEKYQIIATLDSRTSNICQAQDLKVYTLDEYEIGKTASPFHPNCRSTQAPYFEGVESTRIARGEDGKTYSVDGNLKYSDWLNKYVRNV